MRGDRLEARNRIRAGKQVAAGLTTIQRVRATAIAARQAQVRPLAQAIRNDVPIAADEHEVAVDCGHGCHLKT
jgi:hypothetical protein